MSPSLFVSQLIGSAGGSTLLLALIIAVATFFFEDTTTIIVGVLAADGILPVPFALASLYTGIIIGDLCLYALGRAASTHPRLARFVEHDLLAAFRAWLESRFILTVFTARFIPGSRLPTYTASGFFRSPLGTFIGTATVATSIWTTFLFSASYWLGNATSTWVSEARWGLALLIIIVLFLVARRNLRLIQEKRSPTDTQ